MLLHSLDDFHSSRQISWPAFRSLSFISHQHTGYTLTLAKAALSLPSSASAVQISTGRSACNHVEAEETLALVHAHIPWTLPLQSNHGNRTTMASMTNWRKELSNLRLMVAKHGIVLFAEQSSGQALKETSSRWQMPPPTNIATFPVRTSLRWSGTSIAS